MSQSKTTLGVEGDDFTINGDPTFLLGASYFDGRFWHESDLDRLADDGFNLIRVWLDWGDHNRGGGPESSYFDADGSLSSGGRDDLRDLVRYADARGMVVDVTILDKELTYGASMAEHREAVQSVANALEDYDNVLYDLQNEHDQRGSGSLDHGELAELREIIESVDPSKIVTVSTGDGGIISKPGGDLRRGHIDDEIEEVGVDVLAPHLPRTPDWARETDDRVEAIEDYLRDVGHDIPIYLQEDARRGHSGLNPSRGEFLDAATDAKAAGAAGWVFHTDAGFDLGDESFYAALDRVEREVVSDLADALGLAGPDRDEDDDDDPRRPDDTPPRRDDDDESTNGRELTGGDDDDWLRGGSRDDILVGGDGDDRLLGRAGDDRLEGGDGGYDRLYGHEGDDTLIGGPGQDKLKGGPDADRFVLERSNLVDGARGDGDNLMDYNRAEGDVIDLSDLLDRDAARDIEDHVLVKRNSFRVDQDGPGGDRPVEVGKFGSLADPSSVEVLVDGASAVIA